MQGSTLRPLLAGGLSLRLLPAVSADDEADNKLHCTTLHHCYVVVKLV